VNAVHRVPVQSNTVKSVGHDPKTLTLEIEFHNGNVYQYFDVPVGVHADFMQASSLGTFFNKQIKGHYRYAKL
jgi:hypothetical protein